MTTAALKETVEITETVEETVLEETVLEETIETVTQETEADAFESSLGEESDRTELYSYKTFATEVSSAPVQNSFHRFGSDFCILQNRRRIIKGFDCTQKRHTNVGDTPYNTEPFNQGKGRLTELTPPLFFLD
ncbi:hypothetical protein BY458DRAFT_136432 [Sporodiniella umbellata]|nr:hypothetical protein BY458DRAFT_136432 [Sporodiniella umbellata]